MKKTTEKAPSLHTEALAIDWRTYESTHRDARMHLKRRFTILTAILLLIEFLLVLILRLIITMLSRHLIYHSCQPFSPGSAVKRLRIRIITPNLSCHRQPPFLIWFCYGFVVVVIVVVVDVVVVVEGDASGGDGVLVFDSFCWYCFCYCWRCLRGKWYRTLSCTWGFLSTATFSRERRKTTDIERMESKKKSLRVRKNEAKRKQKESKKKQKES